MPSPPPPANVVGLKMHPSMTAFEMLTGPDSLAVALWCSSLRWWLEERVHTAAVGLACMAVGFGRASPCLSINSLPESCAMQVLLKQQQVAAPSPPPPAQVSLLQSLTSACTGIRRQP